MLAAESSRETNSSLVTVKFPRWTLSTGNPTRMIFSADSDCAKQESSQVSTTTTVIRSARAHSERTSNLIFLLLYSVSAANMRLANANRPSPLTFASSPTMNSPLKRPT